VLPAKKTGAVSNGSIDHGFVIAMIDRCRSIQAHPAPCRPAAQARAMMRAGEGKRCE
jgi:hypothetical protein